MRKKIVNLDITNKCSNFCPGCMRQTSFKNKNIPGGDISIENMKKIANYFDEIMFVVNHQILLCMMIFCLY